jgi:hypothetical protein
MLEIALAHRHRYNRGIGSVCGTAGAVDVFGEGKICTIVTERGYPPGTVQSAGGTHRVLRVVCGRKYIHPM